MDFNFNINAVLHETITEVTAQPKLTRRNDGGQGVKNLENVIDTIGVKSAHAQNLSAPITSWVKLRINNHRIYILKDASGNNGHGCVIGFIKIGRKQLFVLDRDGTHNEMHPLCVLDFYIHESQQRRGYGLKLYKHMLQAEGVEPAHLAVDRPSSKFTSFLRKHFNLWATLPQVNNFVVFDGFFKNRKDCRPANSRRGSHCNANDFRPLSRAVSDNVIKRTRQTNFGFNDSLNGVRPQSGSHLSSDGDQTGYSRFNRTGQGARANMFSRFTADEKSTVPPTTQSRRGRRVRPEEEIITNPYRRVTNNYSKTEPDKKRDIINDLREKDAAILRDGGNFVNGGADKYLRSKSQTPTDDYNKPGEEPKNMEAEHSDLDNKFRATENRAPTSDLQVKDENHEVDVGYNDKTASYDHFRVDKTAVKDLDRTKFFLAKKDDAGDSIKSPLTENTTYGNPSDMIVELQQKDRERKNVQTPIRRYLNNPRFGSSWNVFGVPSPARWKEL